MRDGKIVLIAYHMLESSLGAYLEWLTAKNLEHKDAPLVMLPANALNQQAK